MLARKMALAILSGMSANDFAICVNNNDTATLVKLPGVGKKTAERLLIEMRDKIGDIDTTAGGASGNGSLSVQSDLAQEAESALIALGYKPTDAAKIINRVADESVTDAGQLDSPRAEKHECLEGCLSPNKERAAW